ncbi:MAG: hypothetical protein LBI39_01195 [Puniceicoccales bacterium]|nr:hypothetical protein [Puniceicoccales bacterium]
MDEFADRLKKQIEENKLLIAETKQAMDKMRNFFKGLGADLDSGRNIFLESPLLSEEDRRQTMEAIGRMEEEMAKKHGDHLKSSMRVPADRKSDEEADREEVERQHPVAQAPRRKSLKKMRL